MQAVLSVIIPLLGAISLLIAAFFGLRAVFTRAQQSKQAYGVGQLESRRSMQKDFIWAAMALVVGLLFFGVNVLLPDGGESMLEPVVTAEPTAATMESTSPAAETAVPQSTQSPTPAPFPTTQVTVLPTQPPAATPTNIPTSTPEPSPQTAVVASGVGVYLRQEPSTSAPDLEWLLDGTQLVVLPQEATADGYDWVLVRTPEGNEGWVAIDFIEIDNGQ